MKTIVFCQCQNISRGCKISGVLLGLLLMLSMVGYTNAANHHPVPPLLIWGSLSIDGFQAPDGIEIEATIDGSEVAATISSLGGYRIDVDGHQGDLVELYVEDILVTQTVYPSPTEAHGQYIPLDVVDPVAPSSTFDLNSTVSTVDNTFVFIGSAQDTESQISSPLYQVQYNINGQDWKDAKPRDGAFDSPIEEFEFSLVSIPEGNYVITVRSATGPDNIESPPYSTQVIDIINPVATITLDDIPDFTNEFKMIHGTTDSRGGFSSVQVLIKDESNGFFWNGNNWDSSENWIDANGSTSWDFPMPSLTHGITYTVMAKALNGEKIEPSMTSDKSTYDNVAPVITGLSSLSGFENNNSIRINGMAKDTTSPIDIVEWRIDGYGWHAGQATDRSFDSLTEDFTFLTSGLTDGSHTIEVRCSDTAGNIMPDSNYAVYRFLMNAEGPSVIIADFPSDPTNSNISVLGGTATSPTGTISLVEFRVDDGKWTVAQPTDTSFNGETEEYIFTVSELNDGTHVVEVRAVDDLGNITPNLGYARQDFRIDTTKPSLSALQISDITSNSALVSWQSSEECIHEIEYGTDSLYGTEITERAWANNTSIEITGLSPSTSYYFKATSHDMASNVTSFPNRIFTTLPNSVEIDTIVSSTIKNGLPDAIDAVDKADTRISFEDTGEVSGTVVVARYGNAPELPLTPSTSAGDNGLLSGPVKFVDVYILGFSSGTATLEMHYADNEIHGIDEQSLGLSYWNGSYWQPAENVQTDSSKNTVSGEIPVAHLKGTAVGMSGIEWSPSTSSSDMNWMIAVMGILIALSICVFVIYSTLLNKRRSSP